MGWVELEQQVLLDNQVQEVVFHNQDKQDMVVMEEVEAVPVESCLFQQDLL